MQNFAFNLAQSLNEINLNKVVQILDNCFTQSSLSSITISDVTILQATAFYECLELESIVVDDKNTEFSSKDGVLFNKTKTRLIQYPPSKSDTTYIIPDTVEVINNDSFRFSKNLQELTIILKNVNYIQLGKDFETQH